MLGPCIAVTTGEVLDYFGAMANIAAPSNISVAAAR